MNPARIVLAAAAFALVLKLAWAATSTGTNDTVVFYLFGKLGSAEGLLELYSVDLFNHTPLVGTYVTAIFDLAKGKGQPFAFLLRAPGILADFGAVLALLWLRRRTGQPPWWALILFALSPVSLMVSGYHGNVDSILAFALVLTACGCVARHAAFCGLAFAFALQIKIVPLLFAPALFVWWWQQGNARTFFLTTVFVTLAGWIVPLVAVPDKFIGNVLTYPSYWGSWGITMWCRMTGFADFQNVGFTGQTEIQRRVCSCLKAIIIGAALWLAWKRRACEAPGVFKTLALTWLVFFTFAPGFGPQYLVWLMPFVLVLSPRWYAILTLASSIFLYRFYDVISKGWPWHIGVSTTELELRWVWWTVLPWFVLLAWTMVAIHEEFKPSDSLPAEPQLTS